MLHLPSNCGFSAHVVFRNKTLRDGKGLSLVERCNAVAERHMDALRVSLSASTNCVVLLGKGSTLTCEARLAVNADKLTETAIGR